MGEQVEQPFIDAAGVATLLFVDERTVVERLRHKDGFPKPFKPGKKLLWDRGEVIKYVRKHREN